MSTDITGHGIPNLAESAATVDRNPSNKLCLHVVITDKFYPAGGAAQIKEKIGGKNKLQAVAHQAQFE
jgi:hypothetical protein